MAFTTSEADLLAGWERGLASSGQGRALELHRMARPDTDPRDLLRVPAGMRETDLYALRRALFGDRLDVLAECGSCGAAIEVEIDAGALARRPVTDSEGDPGAGPLRFTEDGWDVEFRLPAVGDLAAAAATGDLAAARRQLVMSCVLAASRDGCACDPAGLPDQVLRRLAAECERADPAAEVTLRLICPQCAAVTPAELDVADCVWAELDSWARETLLDVHLLARAYGWTEPEVLALSPLRRRYYLELCTDA